MSLLIEFKKRIKAVEVTKKTTNAMRLIAMSSHTRLKDTKDTWAIYQKTIQEIHAHLTTLMVKTAPSTPVPEGKRLVIIVGSQKGLCGTFNAAVAAYTLAKERTHKDAIIIVIGKQLHDFIKSCNITIDHVRPAFTSTQVPTLAEEMSALILTGNYREVTFYSTEAQGFFISKPKTTTFSPTQYSISDEPVLHPHDLLFEQSFKETWNLIGTLDLNARLHLLLIDSLLAEQAARFISMDTATRNAEELITEMKLNYNKLRQSAITRELTDLSGSSM